MDRPSLTRRDFLGEAAAFLALGNAARLTAAEETPPLPRRGKRRKVIVLGAGLAGLVAAYELTEAGHDVVVLEASRHAGGRVYTLRGSFSDGLHAEAGAVFIPDSHQYTLRYVKQFNLPLIALPADRAVLYFLRNQRIAYKQGAALAWPVELTDDERKLGLDGLFTRHISALAAEAGDVLATSWPGAELRKHDRASLADVLDKRGVSAAGRELLALGSLRFWGDGPEHVSALALMRDLALIAQFRQQFYIKGGNDQLPAAFASRLRDRIRYGMPATALHQDANGVKVVSRYQGREHTEQGDYLICTIPFSVLRSIPITPEPGAGKRQAIRELPYTSNARIFVQARNRVWAKEGKSLALLTDLPVMLVQEAPYAEPGDGPRGLLDCYIGGPQARAVGALPAAQRVPFALESLKKVFPDLPDQCEGGTSYIWDDDPWAKGAHCCFKPGQFTTLAPHLATPEGRIFFAGEHTSPWTAWMQGALHSGLRAAREVNDLP